MGKRSLIEVATRKLENLDAHLGLSSSKMLSPPVVGLNLSCISGSPENFRKYSQPAPTHPHPKV